MRDHGDFEDRLRDALQREASELPFRIDAVTVHERKEKRRSRLPGWLMPVAVPVGAAIVVAAVALNAFPGRPLEPGLSPSATEAAAPTTRPSTASPATATPRPTPHPADRVDAGVAIDDDRLLLVGGRRASGSTASVVAFDGLEWSDLPALPVRRYGAGVAVLADGRLVVAGGERDGVPLDSVLVLEPNADAWTDGPSMPHAQAFMGAALLEGRLHLFGGSVAEHAREVLILDPDAGTWSSGTTMPVAASRVAVAVFDGAAYLFGGRSEPEGTDLASTLRYDPAFGAWSALADMPGGGSAMSATLADRRIWILGVPQEDIRVGKAYVYHPDSNTWTERETRVSDGWHAAMLLGNGRILVVGGGPFLNVRTVDTRMP